jgi:AcrR family transcriptional regulator
MGSNAGMTRRSRRIDAKSNAARIVEAARQVFATPSSHTLEDIAAVANVGIATLYRHFPSREELTRAVYTQIFDADIRPLLTLRPDTPVRDTVTAVGERLLELIDNEPGLIASADDFAALTDDQLRRFIEPFTELLDQAQVRGEIRSDLEPRDIPQLLVMLVAGLSTPAMDHRSRSRYLALLLDAIEPRSHREALPPLKGDTSETSFDGFRAALGTTVRTP